MATYRIADMDGVRWALDATPTGSPDDAAGALLREVPGGRVDTADDALVAALVARGGRLRRRAHDMEYDLAAGVPAVADPPGYDFAPVTGAAALVAAHRAAFPPGHVDHRPPAETEGTLAGILAGRILGPFVAAASWQAERAGRVAGAVLVVNRPAFGDTSARAWIVDLFADPAHQGRGLGAALTARALAGCREAGFRHVGLVVTDGNPARRTYDRAGFRVVFSGTTVDLPG